MLSGLYCYDKSVNTRLRDYYNSCHGQYIVSCNLPRFWGIKYVQLFSILTMIYYQDDVFR